jgi:mono/diheme cytochrome c family protein
MFEGPAAVGLCRLELAPERRSPRLKAPPKGAPAEDKIARARKNLARSGHAMTMHVSQRVRHVLLAAAVVAPLGWTVYAQTAGDSNAGADFAPKPPVLARSPEDQARTFVLPTGYRMELVLAEPDVDTPAVIEFDGNGRLYVAEFMTYMPDVEGNNQTLPASRITRFEDRNADGTYETRTVFADKLVLPRAVLPLDGDSILTNETHTDNLVKLTDTNGDGIADRREIFYTGVGLNRDGNLEHEQSGFVWGLDNWIYSTYNAFRFRWTPAGMLREATGSNGGQWGLTQDDDGKMWFVCAGCERGPLNFQVPIRYGAFRVSDEYEPGFDVVWPIAGVGDVQGGMGRVRMPLGTVNHATATAGPDIVRAHRVPADLVGDLLYAEPVGRLIRRAKIVTTEGLTQVRNAYPGSEFVLSSDLLFRPVNIRTAPDGTVYIADMYHGIIQEAQWTGPGSYLRHKILQYQLDRIVHRGRIWRLRFDGVAAVPATPSGPAARALPGEAAIPAIALDLTQPRMLNETPAELVAHLSHANGWWRDTAQRLLVLKQDTSVVPTLTNLARSAPTLVARFHALWTLEGLNALDASLVRDQMTDPSPRMRLQAIRASETLYKAGNRSFEADYRQALNDGNPDVAIQAMMTLNVLRAPDIATIVTGLMGTNGARGVQELGKLILSQRAAAATAAGRSAVLSTEHQQQMDRGRTIYDELCFSCHGDDGLGAPHAGGAAGATMAPPLGGSPRVQGHRDYVVKTVLHGLTGPVDGKLYTEVMIPMRAQQDDWVAAIASYVRNSFGNTAGFVTTADVTRVRATSASRRSSWTVPELEASLPVMLPASDAWRATASHNSDRAGGALTLAAWSSGPNPPPGMWFQVELPEPVQITEVQFNVAGAGRGGGGRGAAASPPLVRQYAVVVSIDGKTWGKPVGAGSGTTGLSTIGFMPVRAKFVRVLETHGPDNAAPWTISNLRVFQAPAAPTRSPAARD